MILKGKFLVWNEETKKHEDYEGFFAGISQSGENGDVIYSHLDPHGFGKTHIEAVANLYIDLHESKNS